MSGKFVVQQKPQRVESGLDADEVLAEIAQQRFQRDEILDVIIDK